MTHVTIIGTGNMGQAIAGVVTKGGNTTELIGHSDSSKPITGEIVVLAVPYPAVADILATRGDQLASKMVVDITNPLNYETFDSLTVPADSSAAAQIAADSQAKSQLADVVTAGGLRAIDSGSLRRARELEALGFLQITLAAQDKMPWTGGFAVAG